MRFTELAIDDSTGLIFGTAPRPVTSGRGLTVGGGQVYPELNFTLPTMEVNARTYPEIKEIYRNTVDDVLTRAAALHVEGIVVEFETLLEMTLEPAYGIELTEVLVEACERLSARYGMKAEVRLTPNDTRDYERPPRMRNSPYLENMLRLFDEGAKAGATFLSIESTGGKELHDEALVNCDIQGVVFALGVLGVRDMRFLWDHITKIANDRGVIAGGDTACGFANTAMVLAEKQYIPRVFAAVDRAASIPRSLVAYERGARGPDKDCGYEGVFLKAIAGVPISMEGKTAACAHASPVGNVSMAACDLWSNESVQAVHLLGGPAPVVSLEQLAYDVRLLNESIRTRQSLLLRDMLVGSDIPHDPQALILAPDSVIRIARAVVAAGDHLTATLAAVGTALEIIEEAVHDQRLRMDPREEAWVTMIREQLAQIPHNEDLFVEMMQGRIDSGKVLLEEYGL